MFLSIKILEWLKETVKEAFILIKNKDPILEQAENVRQTKYVKTPRNIYRHILLSGKYFCFYYFYFYLLIF